MVTVIQKPKSIGESFGEGLKNTLVPYFQQQLQRGQVQNSLQQVKELANNPNATSFDLATALISSTAGIPGSEKYVGQLFPLLNQQLQRQRSVQDFGLKTGNPNQTENFQPQNYEQVAPGSSNQNPPQLFEFLPPNPEYINPALANPGEVPNLALPYPDPLFESHIRQLARVKGYSPEIEEAYVNEAKAANQNAMQNYSFKIAQYNQNQAQKRDALENFNNVKSLIETETPEFRDLDDKQLALKTAQEIIDKSYVNGKQTSSLSPNEVLTEVKNKLRPYQAAVNSLKEGLKRPLFGRSDQQLEVLKDKAQLMVDNGQKDKLKLMIASGGNGEVEEAILTNDLPSNLKNYFKEKINKKEKIINPLSEVKVTDPDSTQYQKQLEKGIEKKNKQMNEILDYLDKNFETGTYNKPGTNLILLRKNLMDLGLDYLESGNLITRLVQKKQSEKNNFLLDSNQINDYQKLSYPPLGGDNYLGNILQYYLFGKE